MLTTADANDAGTWLLECVDFGIGENLSVSGSSHKGKDENEKKSSKSSKESKKCGDSCVGCLKSCIVL